MPPSASETFKFVRQYRCELEPVRVTVHIDRYRNAKLSVFRFDPAFHGECLSSTETDDPGHVRTFLLRDAHVHRVIHVATPRPFPLAGEVRKAVILSQCN